MANKKDGRTVRGAVRRAVWRDAVRALESEDGEATEIHALGPELLRLYQQTRLDMLRWMQGRARGVMGPPPGGVGTRGAR